MTTEPETPPTQDDLTRKQWLLRKQIAARATIELVRRKTDETGVLLIPHADGIDAA